MHLLAQRKKLHPTPVGGDDGEFGQPSTTPFGTHYFLRKSPDLYDNTGNARFSPFSYLSWKVLKIVARCSHVSFYRWEKIAPGRWTGTIAREADHFAGSLFV